MPTANAAPLRQDATPVPNAEDCTGCHEGLRGYWEQSAHGYALAVSYTHLRAHETVLDLVCRLLLEKKKHHTPYDGIRTIYTSYLVPLLSVHDKLK